ncbi:MAG: T9SS type A sorting domain-containing protein [bacterium]|nr:T9SS type A sorting domain-containing protein [bacterium]
MRFNATAKLLLIGCLLLGCSGVALAEVELVVHDLVQVGDDFSSLVMDLEITNLESGRETVYLSKDDHLPLMWTSPMCVGDTCWEHEVMEVSFSLNGYETVEFGIHINMFNQAESGYTNFRVYTAGSPLDQTFVLAGVNSNCEILVVDDGVRDPASVEETIRAAGYGSHAVGFWPAQDHAPTLSDLQNFELVIWCTGGQSPSLTEEEQEMLASYQTGGGGLMLASEGLAYDLCDPGSPNYDSDNVTWFANTMGLEYIGQGANADIVGTVGDPLGSGLAFTLSGEGHTPDLVGIVTADPASVAFSYGDAAVAGVSVGYDTTFLGFGLEDCGANIGTIIDRAFALLTGPVGVEDDTVPAKLQALGNYPNPFNPTTSFKFVAPTAGLAAIEIMDLQGRRVADLKAAVSAGTNSIPFQADELGSGIYLYRISLNGDSVNGKMTLVK